MSKRMPKELGNTLADCLEVYAKINGKPLEYWIDLEAKYRRCQDQLVELMRIHWDTVKSGFEHLIPATPNNEFNLIRRQVMIETPEEFALKIKDYCFDPANRWTMNKELHQYMGDFDDEECTRLIEARDAAIRKECADSMIAELESWEGQDWSDLSKEEAADLIKRRLRAAIEGKEST